MDVIQMLKKINKELLSSGKDVKRLGRVSSMDTIERLRKIYNRLPRDFHKDLFALEKYREGLKESDPEKLKELLRIFEKVKNKNLELRFLPPL